MKWIITSVMVAAAVRPFLRPVPAAGRDDEGDQRGRWLTVSGLLVVGIEALSRTV
jgi:hypothetical protein